MTPRGDPATAPEIVVMGASSGGITPLSAVMRELPDGLAAAVFVVVHMSYDSPNLLPSILQKASRVPVVSPEDHAPIERGHVYVAPPDRHLLIEPAEVRVVRGPEENGHRPAIDPLFRSAASSYGPRVAGIVLSGNLSDGAAGLWAIKSSGGVTIVQDPDEATSPDMPESALGLMDVDYSLPATEIGRLVARLAGDREAVRTVSLVSAPEIRNGERTIGEDQPALERSARVSAFTCPACGGALWEMDDGKGLRYRCRTGHAFSGDALRMEQAELTEDALYSALRALKERAELIRRLSQRYGDQKPQIGERYEEEIAELERHADVLRNLLAGKAA